MTITTAQIRGARGLLDWSQAELSRRTDISTTSIGNIESGHTQARESTLAVIRKAFEDGGIEFVEGGARHRNDLITVFEKQNENDVVYLKLMDDVFYTLKDSLGEVLFSFVDNALSPESVKDRQHAMRNAGITMRFLVRYGDTNLLYPTKEYRYLPEGTYLNNPCVVYGDKVGLLVEDATKVIIVKNKSYAEMMRKYFEMVWNYGVEPKVKK